MDKKIAISIAVVVVVILAILGGLFVLGNADVTLESTDSIVTLPNTYVIDETGSATNHEEGTTIMFIGMIGSPNNAIDLGKALLANGNSSGYENISEDTVNGFKVYEYAAKPDNLKTLKYGSSTEWTEYSPENLTDTHGSKINADHYRRVYYISPNNSTCTELTIIATKADTNLYSSEINEMIHSIALKNSG